MKDSKAVLRRRRLGAMPRWSLPAAFVAMGFGPAYAEARPDCQPQTSGGPLFITPGCIDPALSKPYIDIDQPGTTTDPVTGVTVKYRYVHGGFTDSNTRFALYFPAPDAYKGWFIESTYPTVSTEPAGADTIAFGISHGAYVVSTNNNGGVPAGGALAAYRANAAATKFSRIEAAKIYGDIASPRGFIYGASGGAYQTIGAAENTDRVWDGSMPMVNGGSNAIPSFQSTFEFATQWLTPVLPEIARAEEAGGSGNPYARLSPMQQSVLHEITDLGFPLRGWWQYGHIDSSFLAVEGGVEALDPSYVSDFWTKAGYEGSDSVVAATRIQSSTTVTGIVGTTKLKLADIPPGNLVFADLIITSGSSAGTVLKIASTSGDTVVLASSDGDLIGSGTGQSGAGLAPGTTVMLDNSWAVALEYYPRHQVPTPVQQGWKQYVGTNGQPLYPQRPFLVGPFLDANTSGSVESGLFHGKMIELGSVMDVQAFAWPSDWYRQTATSVHGASFMAHNYRLWFMDNADHDPPGPAQSTSPVAADHIVPYQGEYEQGLLFLNNWVANKVAPPPTTSYTISADSAVVLGGTSLTRGGVQPFVSLTVGGASKVTIDPGQTLTFTLQAMSVTGGGPVATVEWDLVGSGTYGPALPVHAKAGTVNATQTFNYSSPGTYLATARVSTETPSSLPGVSAGKSSPYGRVQNISSVLVVVR